MTSNAKAEGRFGKQDFRYVTEEDVYLCPAGEILKETGFVEGQNVAIEYRSADNQPDRLAALVTDFIQRPVSVIVGNTESALAAKCGAGALLPWIHCYSGPMQVFSQFLAASGLSSCFVGRPRPRAPFARALR
jgi:hypothetical protein